MVHRGRAHSAVPTMQFTSVSLSRFGVLLVGWGVVGFVVPVLGMGVHIGYWGC